MKRFVILICVMIAIMLHDIGFFIHEARAQNKTNATQAATSSTELRGAWVWSWMVDREADPEAKIDEWLDIAEAAHLNTLYLLCRMSDGSQYRHLKSWITKAKSRGLEVHAWFLNNGQIEPYMQNYRYKPMFGSEEWFYWFDHGSPATREFEATSMMNILDRYPELDGVMFDYIRFDENLGSVQTGTKEAALADGINLDVIANDVYGALPVPAFGFMGNTGASMTTAKVLAEFDNGLPAITLNKIGKGATLIFHWNNVKGVWEMPLVAKTAKMFLSMYSRSSDMYVEADGQGKEVADDWAKSMGYNPKMVSPSGLGSVPVEAPIVLPRDYSITESEASALKKHVENGGLVICVEAPVLSLGSVTVQQLCGFSGGGYFSPEKPNRAKWMRITPDGTAYGLPVTNVSDAEQERLANGWIQWQNDQITKLVSTVRSKVKAKYPNKYVSASVFASEGNSEFIRQQWDVWTSQGVLDQSVPMAYVSDANQISELLPWWESFDPNWKRITPGIALDEINAKGSALVSNIKSQVDLYRSRGAKGIVLFTLEFIGDLATAKLIGQNVFPGTKAPYHPGIQIPPAPTTVSPSSVNDGTGTDIDGQEVTTSLSANWSVAADAVSGIARYEYAIGTAAKGSQVKNWTSAGTATKVTASGLTLKLGTAYYVSVRAVNKAGLVGTVVSSDGVKIVKKPVGPKVVNDGTGTDIDTQESTTSLSVNWPAATDAVSGIARYEYAIGTSAKGSEVKTWASAGTATKMTVTGLSLKVGMTYYVSVRAVNNAGLVGTVASSDGVKVMGKPVGPSSVNDGTGSDVDIQEGTTSLSANWPVATDAVSGIAKYEYAIGTSAKGTQVKGWTSAGAATKVAVRGLTLKLGTAYYVSVRAVNKAGLVGTVVSSDGVKVVKKPVGPKVVNDGTGADIDTQEGRTGLSANWPAATDAVSGIARYEYAIGTTAKGTNVKTWTSAGTATKVTVTGLSLNVGTTYYVSVRAVNGVGLAGTVACSDGVRIAASSVKPPVGPKVVNDGTGTDIDTQESATGLSANWPVATDAVSGIARYEYAIGTSAKATNIKDWTSVGTATMVTVSGLSLKVGTTYFLSVRAVNGVGLAGTVVSSDGVKIVASPVNLAICSGTVFALAASGNNVYAGGDFQNAGGNPNADCIARWDGKTWQALGGMNGTVYALATSGNSVYAGGWFTKAGGNPSANVIARWDGKAWQSVGGGVNSTVYAIAVSGNNVYVGGRFSKTGDGQVVNQIARWDGQKWNKLGDGLPGMVTAIAVRGSEVYAAGDFQNAGGDPNADYLACWDGQKWKAVGSGLSGTSSAIYALAVTSTNLYVGGFFTNANGNPDADYVVRWDGQKWYSLGKDVSGAVKTLLVNGNTLYVGGYFRNQASTPNTSYVASWDGQKWKAVDKGTRYGVHALAIGFNTLYAGGELSSANGAPALGFSSLSISSSSTLSTVSNETTDNVGETKAYEYGLDQNYPNPFNPTTTIRYSLKETGRARLVVYDISGRQVLERDLEGQAGWNTYQLDGSMLSSGVYFYRLTAKNFSKTLKMMLLK